MANNAPRRSLLKGCAVLYFAATTAWPAYAKDDWQSIAPGTVVLFRHATAPGGSDPAGFQLEDCRTQRNLSTEGRVQASAIGNAFRQRNIPVTTVWSSQWCRTRDTADRAFPGLRIDQPAFNSFFANYSRESPQTQAALDLLALWKGQDVLVVFTHQVNITALTGIVPESGEGVVVALSGRELKVLGRIKP